MLVDKKKDEGFEWMKQKAADNLDVVYREKTCLTKTNMIGVLNTVHPYIVS